MRMKALVIAAAVLCAGRVHAQDLQFRMATNIVMPSMPTAPQAPVMTLYAKGSMLRVDVDLSMPEAPDGGMHASTIVDLDAHRMIVLQPAAKIYMEHPFSMPGATTDSSKAGQRLPPISNVTRNATSDTAVIDGYSTQRYVSAMEIIGTMPMEGVEMKDSSKLVLVVEQWLTQDPRLATPYEAFTRIMQRAGSGNPVNQLLGQTPPGFPMRSHMLMVQVPRGSAYDAEAILRAGDAAPNVMMAMHTEAQNIRVGVLDPALFTVPSDYTKH